MLAFASRPRLLLGALLVACTTSGELPAIGPDAATPAESPTPEPPPTPLGAATPSAASPPNLDAATPSAATPPTTPALAAVAPQRLHPATSTAELFGITGDDAGLVLAVGVHGTILRSDDHGQSWREVASPSASHLAAAWRSPQGSLFAAGSDGTILRSRDRGLTWHARTSGTPHWLRHLAGNPHEILAAGDHGTILRSRDDGDTWTSVAMPTLAEPSRKPSRDRLPPGARPPPPGPDDIVRSMYRPDEDVRGLAAPRPGELWIALRQLVWQRPDDAGAWRVLARTAPPRDSFANLWVGDTHWVVSGRNRGSERPSYFVGTGTAGTAPILSGWSQIDSRLISPPIVTGAPTGAPPILYLAGDGYAVHWSEDGGLRWADSEQSAVMQSPYPLAKRAMWVAPDGIVHAAGTAGAVMRSTDHARTWTVQNGGAREPLFGGALARDGSIYTAVAFAVLRGRADHWQLLSPTSTLPVGGHTEAPTSRGLVRCCTDVWVAPDGTILAAGNGLVWRSRDDGRSWKKTHDSDPRWDCCWSLWGDDRGVHGIDRDVILSSIDHGKTWTRSSIAHLLTRDDGNRLDISGSDDHLLVVGGPGLILHSSDRGRTWARRTSPTREPLHAGFVATTATGLIALAAGEHGTLLRSTDAIHWQQIALPTTMRLLGIHGDEARGELYLAGESGLLRSRDDGLTWALDPTVREPLRSVFGDDRGQVLVAGERGLVLRLP
ncbi:YCF48-related protein [Nannocystis sp.]|uniref:WD40/YVTN/BNR-like repeat-containing protein n=1 Tax=Nannocystis sp. TaxID=1962667 RepID=UPI0025F56BBC|nr:YCF48-related protein [Nannocystis sp.]MBK7825768.1 hypothetical protein [Nannocystis sp.]